MGILAPQNPASPSFGRVSKWGTGAERFAAGYCLLFAFLLFAACKSSAQSVSHEYPLKAVFLLNFARFTDWPTNAFPSQDSPFVVGILGRNPFGRLMEETVQGEQINHHKCIVEYYQKPGDIKSCDVLFIARSEDEHLERILADLKGKPILTVADFPNGASRGACIQFYTQDNKIRFLINLGALKEARLTMSSELLRLAGIVSN